MLSAEAPNEVIHKTDKVYDNMTYAYDERVYY